jgi:NADH dehydrogenase
VIVGGGFRDLKAAKESVGLQFDITIVDQRNHHISQLLLYQVAAASLATSGSRGLFGPSREDAKSRPGV